MGYRSLNKYPAKCFRCGEVVPAGGGDFFYGSGSDPYHWPQHQYRRNIPLVEHFKCAEKYKGTGVHYQFSPDTSMEGFDDNLGLQTDLDP
jgi:hypothetical protein